MLKWYVDRITEAERQEHIQEVLKVMAPLRTANRGSQSWREMIAASLISSAQTVISDVTFLTFRFKDLNQFMAAPELMKFERVIARPVHWTFWVLTPCSSGFLSLEMTSRMGRRSRGRGKNYK